MCIENKRKKRRHPQYFIQEVTQFIKYFAPSVCGKKSQGHTHILHTQKRL